MLLAQRVPGLVNTTHPIAYESDLAVGENQAPLGEHAFLESPTVSKASVSVLPELSLLTSLYAPMDKGRLVRQQVWIPQVPFLQA